MNKSLPKPPPRPTGGHKGTFGTVIVVGGSPTMIGAPAMTATAALRSGVGLVKIAAAASIIPHCLTIEPSATGMVLSDDFTEVLEDHVVLAVGPGMGRGTQQQRLIHKLLSGANPMVLDADGLNNLSDLIAQLSNGKRTTSLEVLLGMKICPLVMTPHPGEAARLASAYNLEQNPLYPDQRTQASLALSHFFQATVVLKGSGTIIAHEGLTFLNHTGNPALATAGSGDILTGMIASFIAQGMTLGDASTLAVHIHGLAADRWADAHGQSGLLALELTTIIPDVIQEFRSNLY